MGRVAAFISHSFSAVPEYIGVLDMFERQGLAFVNRSVPAWNPLAATGAALARKLEERIRFSSRVIVLVTEKLHEKPCVKFEIETARKYGKPIIAMYPNGEFGRPMPRSLNDSMYRAIGWRGNALERAIEGDYPQDARVFDIAEEAELREVVRWTLGGIGAAAILLAGATQERVRILRAELQTHGLASPQPRPIAPDVVPWIIGGAIFGAFLGSVMGGRGSSLAWGALGGAALGGGLGLIRHANLELRDLGPLIEARRLPEPAHEKGASDTSAR